MRLTVYDSVVQGNIDSVKNPASGSIFADSIGEIIMEPNYTAPSKIIIHCK